MPSPSDALKAVIEPLLELIEPGPGRTASFQNALELGREAWNLHVKCDAGGGDLETALDRASQRFARDDVPASEARLVLQMLLDRKRALYPGDDRVLLDAVAVETEDGLQLKVTWAKLGKIH